MGKQATKTTTCGTCKGSGRMDVKFYESGRWDTLKMTCVNCDGRGVLTARQVAERDAEAKLWCRCGNPSGDVEFWDDGRHPSCSKHCWTCKDCGKIEQVG